MRLGRFSFNMERGERGKLCPVCDCATKTGLELGFTPCWWGWTLGFIVMRVCHNCTEDSQGLCCGISYSNSKGMRWQEEVLDPVLSKRTRTAKETRS